MSALSGRDLEKHPAGYPLHLFERDEGYPLILMAGKQINFVHNMATIFNRAR
jgi:hypothetical protein